jgi:hypothetical protein
LGAAFPVDKTLLTIVSCFSLALVSAPKADAEMLLTGAFNAGDNDAQNWVNGTIGSYFEVGPSDILVTSLGFSDYSHDGFVTAHTLGIFADDPARTLIASVTLAAGTSAPLVDDWRFAVLETSVTLTANLRYFLGASTATDDGDRWFYGPQDTAVSPNYTFAFPDTTLGRPLLVNKNTGVFVGPDDFGGAANSSYALNMEFTAIPEPSTMGLVLAGSSLGLAFFRRRSIASSR